MRKADVDSRALADLVGRIFPPRGRCTIERTEGGTSTQVYRIRRGTTVFYLRVAEGRAASLAPEVYVHELLRARGVRVPAVIHFEPFDDRLERSVLVTSEIPGTPLADLPDEGTTAAVPTAVLQAAGRDLAAINSTPVSGFGWVKRDTGVAGPLEAEHASYKGFALEHLDHDLAQLEGAVLATAEADTIRGTIARHDAWLQAEDAWLAHGDFDLTHIYQHHGRYSGIIDFGEIRGASRLYDLGHFNLHDGEMVPRMLLPSLLDGYKGLLPLPPEHDRQISLVSVLIGVRALARTVRRTCPDAYQRHLVAAIRRNVALLGN